MKIEICENTRNTLIALIIFGALASISIGGCSMSEQTLRKYAESGLVQKQQEGSQVTIWTKP